MCTPFSMVQCHNINNLFKTCLQLLELELPTIDKRQDDLVIIIFDIVLNVKSTLVDLALSEYLYSAEQKIFIVSSRV